MKVGIVSMRYTKTLVAYTEERGAEDRLYHELATLAHGFRTMKGLCVVLNNPIVPVDEKFSLICAAADGDNRPGEEFICFARLVLKGRKETCLQFMSLMYLDLYREKKHISVGKLIIAVPIDKATGERIRQTVAHILHTYMELRMVIDLSIKDDFVSDINNYRLDANTATQLKKVKQQFIDKNRRVV